MGLNRLGLIGIWQSFMSTCWIGILELWLFKGTLDGLIVLFYEAIELKVMRAGSCMVKSIFLFESYHSLELKVAIVGEHALWGSFDGT